MGKNSVRISKIKPFTDEYIWKDTSYQSGKDDWKKFEYHDQKLLLMCVVC